nr:hypothetical protein [Tanacetum cinerariifolium]
EGRAIGELAGDEHVVGAGGERLHLQGLGQAAGQRAAEHGAAGGVEQQHLVGTAGRQQAQVEARAGLGRVGIQAQDYGGGSGGR